MRRQQPRSSRDKTGSLSGLPAGRPALQEASHFAVKVWARPVTTLSRGASVGDWEQGGLRPPSEPPGRMWTVGVGGILGGHGS